MGRGPSPAGIPHWGILGIRGVCGRLTTGPVASGRLPHRPRSSQGVCGETVGRNLGMVCWSGGVGEGQTALQPGRLEPREKCSRERGRATRFMGSTPDRTSAASCEGSRRTDQRRSGSLQPGEVRVKLSDAIREPMRARPAIGGIRP